jgi:hypothetical protein
VCPSTFTTSSNDRPDALITGYVDPPAGVKLGEGMNYNPYFPGGAIGMARILYDGLVEYPDGTPATTSQMAKDVGAFAWLGYLPGLKASSHLPELGRRARDGRAQEDGLPGRRHPLRHDCHLDLGQKGSQAVVLSCACADSVAKQAKWGSVKTRTIMRIPNKKTPSAH